MDHFIVQTVKTTQTHGEGGGCVTKENIGPFHDYSIARRVRVVWESNGYKTQILQKKCSCTHIPRS